MGGVNISWIPQKRLGLCVVALILVTSPYYVIWTDTISIDRGHGAQGLSSVATCQCPTPGLPPVGSESDTTLATNAGNVPPHNGADAPSPAPLPGGPQEEPEFFTELPKDYDFTTEDDELCTLFYTEEYLYRIANSSKSYCDEGSAVYGFDVPTHPHHRKLGVAVPVYLLQGISWDPSHFIFDIQCSGKTGKPVVYGRPLPGLRYGAPESTVCDKNAADRQLIIYPLFKESYDNVWHKLIELMQNKLSLDAARIAINPATGKPFLTPEQAANALVVFPDDIQGPWDDAWEALTGKPPMRYSDLLPDTCYDVLIGANGWSGPLWTALLKTTYETCRRETLLTSFIRWIFKYYGISERPASDVRPQPTITVIQRNSTRKFRDFDGLMEKMHAQHPGYAINAVDLSIMTKKDQIALIHSTDVLVGHHGAGMTYVIFMRPDSAVVEILPPFFQSRGFRWLARMRGIMHFIGKSMWKERYQNKYDGVPIPDGWQPAAQFDGDAYLWQDEEWVWITHDEILSLVDAAVKSQLDGLSDTL